MSSDLASRLANITLHKKPGMTNASRDSGDYAIGVKLSELVSSMGKNEFNPSLLKNAITDIACESDLLLPLKELASRPTFRLLFMHDMGQSIAIKDSLILELQIVYNDKVVERVNHALCGVIGVDPPIFECQLYKTKSYERIDQYNAINTPNERLSSLPPLANRDHSSLTTINPNYQPSRSRPFVKIQYSSYLALFIIFCSIAWFSFKDLIKFHSLSNSCEELARKVIAESQAQAPKNLYSIDDYKYVYLVLKTPSSIVCRGVFKTQGDAVDNHPHPPTNAYTISEDKKGVSWKWDEWEMLK